MPKRCSRCGTLAGRGREVQLPNDWLGYLRDERGLSQPVGRWKMPLCRDCYRDVDRLRSEDGEGAGSVEERDALLDELDLDELVDEQT